MSEIAFIDELDALSRALKTRIKIEPILATLGKIDNVMLALLSDTLQTLLNKGISINNVEVSGYAYVTITFKHGETPIVKLTLEPAGVKLWISETCARDVASELVATLRKYFHNIVRECEKSTVEKK